MADNRILVEAFRHTNWANDQIVRACAQLSAEQLAHDAIGTYGRLDHILIHLARAQGGYLRRLNDWLPGPEHQLEFDQPFPGCEAIAAHLRFTGERLAEVAAAASADRILEFEYEGALERLPAWVVLLQAVQHATEHRQQIATTLTALGEAPPEPDLWAYWDAVGASRDR